ncbi:MFS transporter [Staphylococcus chromogenes]|uniref:MFS transporter n=1 Tax=Staphylococcus chromogenes TaxID=46126 RepID=UPI002DB933C4|nr:MFS transporter [Staphylococcus chromogenes]MEB7825610.1 MFS transporter [Staphylococcus chromogenes]
MKNLYIVSLLRGITIGFYAPIWIIYLYNSGYNLFLLGVIGTVFEIMKFVFEIPSGAISDKFGIKYNLIASFFCLSITWFLFPFSSNLMILIILLLTWTLSETLFSGTFESWISKETEKSDFTRVLFNNTKIFILFIIIISPLASFIYKINEFLPFILAAMSSLILIFFVKIRKSEQNEIEDRSSIIDIIKNASVAMLKNTRTMNIIIASFFFAFVIDTIDRYWQPFFQHINIDESAFGFVTTVGGITLLILLHIFSVFDNQLNRVPERYNVLITFISILLILLLSIGKKVVAFFSVSLVTIADDLMNAVINNAINQEMSDKSTSMATIFSLNGASGALGEILSGVIFGFLILKSGYNLTFIYCSALLVIPLILYIYNVKLVNKKSASIPKVEKN